MTSSINHTSSLGPSPGQSNTDLRAVRDEACARADLRSLAMQAGFREVPRRPKALRCIHGPDRNPSARVYQGRVKCDSCQGSWSPVDLVMLASGVGYVEALKILAADTGVPFTALTADEAADFRRKRAELESTLPVARLWRRAFIDLMEMLLNDLKISLFDASAKLKAEPGEILSLERMRKSIGNASDRDLVGEFRAWRDRWPDFSAGMIRAARHCEQADRRALARYLRAVA